MKLTLRARLALSFALAVAAALIAFSLAVVVVLAFAERAEHRVQGLPFSLSDLEDAPRVLLSMALVAPFAVGGAAALGLWLARKAVAPLKDASERARRARAFDLTLPLRGTFDEWDELASTLNALLGDGRSAFERIRRFTADAAHELRTPLTAIIGEADVTLRKERTAEELRASLKLVHESAVGLAGVIEALLTLARADAGALQITKAACAPDELVADARAQALAVFKDAPGLSVLIEGTATPINGDRILLVRALRNLIENGLRHGGPRVRVQLREQDGGTAIRVDDEGPGIPERLQPLLFQRFAQDDESRSSGGVGLGLSLARAITEAHGGTLQLLPSVRGAAFELRLPRAR